MKYDPTNSVIALKDNGIKTVPTNIVMIRESGLAIIVLELELSHQCGVKKSKYSKNSKNDHWCTNRHMSTKTVPTVYQSSKTVKRQSKQQK